MAYIMQTGKKVDTNGLMSYKMIMNVGKERFSSTIKAVDKDKANDLAGKIEEKIREEHSNHIDAVMKGQNYDEDFLEIDTAFKKLCKDVDGYKYLYRLNMLHKNSTLRDVFTSWKTNTKSKKITIDRHEGNFGHVAFKGLIDSYARYITYPDMENFLTTLRTPSNNRKDKAQKLSEGTVRKYYMTLKMLIDYAVEHHIMPKPYDKTAIAKIAPVDKSPEASFLKTS